jgi:hypothetical protein
LCPMQDSREHEALDVLATRIETIGGRVHVACAAVVHHDSEVKRLSSLAEVVKGAFDRLLASYTEHIEKETQLNKEKKVELDGVSEDAMQAMALINRSLCKMTEAAAAF